MNLLGSQVEAGGMTFTGAGRAGPEPMVFLPAAVVEALVAAAGARASGPFKIGESSGPATRPLFEPLTETEARVLRYLPSNLSGPEIARELFVSVNTVKTHVQHLYAKLGVHRRREAVDRARELGLLGRPSPVRGALSA